MVGEVVELGEVSQSSVGMTRVWKAGAGVSQFIEEGVHHGVNGGQTLGRSVFQQLGDQVNCVGICLAEHLAEWVRLDLGELVFHVVGVHGADLVTSGRAKDLDDFHELVDARLAGEEGLPKHKLRHDAASRPNVNFGGVICSAKDQLRCTVVPRADVRHVWLVLNQNLGASKIAQFEHTSRWIQQKILWLDVSVADPLRVDISERAEELVDVQLDFENGHDRLHLVEVARGPVDSLWNEFEHEVEVHFILPFTIVVEEGLELDDVGMPDDAHDLKLAILEALVLQYSLDGGIFSTRGQFGLEDDTKGAVAYNLALRVRKVLVLARLAVLDLFADNFAHSK